MRYRYLNKNGQRTLALVVDGQVHIVQDSDTNFEWVLNSLRAGDDEAVRDALDLDAVYRDALAAIGNGFTYEAGTVSYEGRPVSDRLNAMIVDTIRSEGDVTPFANFAKRLAANPSYTARESLFGWIEKWGINIDRDGYLIAYKGVTVNANGDYVSITTGQGIVNGVPVSGHLRNNVGDVVEMPRPDVNDNINVHCAQGLHAGTYGYASGFARGALLTVKIDPADVVSVPNDGYQKIRCSKYVVIATAEGEWTASTVWDGVEGIDPLDISLDGDDDDFLDW